YFDRPEWPLRNRLFASDFRAPAEGGIWRFTVETRDDRSPVHISMKKCFDGIDHQVVLIDSARGRTVELTRDSIYTFWPSRADTIRVFQLAMGTSAFIREAGIQADVPATCGLDPGYPNPFNARIIIPYRIAEAAPVRVIILNILGQEVRLVHEGYRHPGYYDGYWDGLDSRGHPLASGVYFVHLQTNGFRQIRKIVLLK
ncbi:T9SS type A sorting domain-containing protein, partial [candidate division KSB1 bacterium]|nr:T9SS type A sorting domain-containing protein [candidate division KSB1 bacterium]